MSDILMCPHCGKAIDLRDHRLKRLTPSAFAVYHQIQDRLRRGERLGSSEVGRIANLTQPGARYHLEQLRRAGLVLAVPKCQGGRYRVYISA